MSSPLASLPLAAAPPIVAPQPSSLPPTNPSKKPSTLYQRCIKLLPGSIDLPKVLAEIVLQYVIPNDGAFAEVPFGTWEWQEYCRVEVDDDGNRLNNPEELWKLIRIYLMSDPIDPSKECWQTHTPPYYLPNVARITQISDSLSTPFTLEQLDMIASRAMFDRPLNTKRQTALIADGTWTLCTEQSVARMRNSPSTSCFLIARKQVLYKGEPMVEQLKSLDALGRNYAHPTVLEVATVVYLHYLHTKEHLLDTDTEPKDMPRTFTSCIDELIYRNGEGHACPIAGGFSDKMMLAVENALVIYGQLRDKPHPSIGIMALSRI